MLLIQILLILAVIVVLVAFLRHHGKSKAAAGVKIAFALFMVFAVVAVLFPNLVSDVAHLVGVGRGTDLLLYAMIVLFGFATVNTYLRFKELEYRYAKLVRAVALRGGVPPTDDPTAPVPAATSPAARVDALHPDDAVARDLVGADPALGDPPGQPRK